MGGAFLLNINDLTEEYQKTRVNNSMNRIAINQNQYESFITNDNWNIYELSLDQLKSIPRVTRPNNIIGGYSSGSLNDFRVLNSQHAIAGIDIICQEPNPYRDRGENDINVYHYVITRTNRPDFPYIIHGEYREGTILGHWPPFLDLEPYERKDTPQAG